MRHLVLTVPGLGRIVRRELEAAGVVSRRVEHDGRADVVPVDGTPPAAMRTAEDVLVEVGSSRAGVPKAIAADVFGAGPALSAGLAELATWRGRPPRHSFRVVVRALGERRFPRTALRAAFTAAAQAALPGRGWHEADPADVELWLLETRPGSYRMGLRLTTVAMRQHDGRAVERGGALRPAVGAAMVLLAGEPAGALVDPCCGSGTLLAEAAALGWAPIIGGDVDGAAVDAARANAPQAALGRWDARALPMRDGMAAAVVTNLPFGRQFDVQGAPVAWYRRTLQECRRLAPRTVVLAPASDPFRRALGRLPFTVDERIDLTLLGTRTSIWSLGRE